MCAQSFVGEILRSAQDDTNKRWSANEFRFPEIRGHTPPPPDHLYLTEQPYGFVLDVLTALPAIDSSRATFT